MDAQHFEQMRREKMNRPAPEPEFSIDEALSGFMVSQSYADGIGHEKWLYENLVIEQQITTVIALSGGGKTTFMFDHVCPYIVRQGYKVWYIDADSPPSDHKRMKMIADAAGVGWLHPDVNQGTSIAGIVNTLQKMANDQVCLKKNVIVFDTIKKFTDLMSKGSVKDFYIWVRKLTVLGATVVALGHANKYRDKDDNLIFEGVNDVKGDADCLLFLEKSPAENGGYDVTTVCDPSKGAKVRGLYKPFSFNISPHREITLLDNVINMGGAVKKASDFEIVETAEKYLKGETDPMPQRPLIEYVSDVTGAGEKRVRGVINKHSKKKGADDSGWRTFICSVGDKNAHFYELNKR